MDDDGELSTISDTTHFWGAEPRSKSSNRPHPSAHVRMFVIFNPPFFPYRAQFLQ